MLDRVPGLCGWDCLLGSSIMNRDAYEAWWPLHLRVALGEMLTSEEQRTYEHGLHQLHEEEVLTPDLRAIKKVRKEIKALEVEHGRLQTKKESLDAEIAVLEAALDDRTRQYLNAEDD